jgi:hypothetical protein
MDDTRKLTTRDLAVRVATLELLVSDLLEIVARVAPTELKAILADAEADLVTQDARLMPGGAEHLRDRLHAVFEARRQRLARRRTGRRPSPETD